MLSRGTVNICVRVDVRVRVEIELVPYKVDQVHIHSPPKSYMVFHAVCTGIVLVERERTQKANHCSDGQRFGGAQCCSLNVAGCRVGC